MTRVKVGDICLGYEVRGHVGDWVVLVQGVGYARWGWSRQIDSLADHFRVIAFDNRGVGESDAPEGPYTTGMMAADTVGLMDALGVEKAHVIGVSLGGLIAQDIAVFYPDRVDKLVLVSTTMGGPDFVPMPDVTLKLIAEAPSLPDAERVRRFILNQFTEEFSATHPEVVDEFVRYRRETAQPLVGYQAQWAAGAGFDGCDRVLKIASETLVITGTHDNVVDSRNAPIMTKAIPGARLVELHGGHSIMVEAAAEFNAAVIGFLKSGGAEEPTPISPQTSRKAN